MSRRKEKPQWQPISALPMIGTMIDGMFEATEEQYVLLHQAASRRGSLDDATVNHAKRVLGTQNDDLWLYEEQCQHWLASPLRVRERREVERLAALTNQIKGRTKELLILLDELSGDTIESLLSKSDLELGIEESERRIKTIKPANKSERHAQKIAKFVIGVMKRGGNDEDILKEMYPYMASFKVIMDNSSQAEMDALCEKYPSFYYFAQLLEDMARGFSDGSLDV